MNTRLTNDRKDLDQVYFSIMKCPSCGYETTVTNVCRTCRANMVYTGFVKRFGKRKRKYAPKNGDEERKLWCGWGVVFEEASE